MGGKIGMLIKELKKLLDRISENYEIVLSVSGKRSEIINVVISEDEEFVVIVGKDLKTDE